MCITVQYFFCCGHPATHRFRNQLCQQSEGRSCRIRDTNKFLEGQCRRCAQDYEKQKRRQQSRVRDPKVFEDTWYIPARCFVDIGYRTLDPFRAEADIDLVSLLTTISPSLPVSPVTPKTGSVWGALPSLKAEKGPVARIFPVFRRHKKASPCCDEISVADAFQAVRLEDYNARVEGRITDNHCESVL